MAGCGCAYGPNPLSKGCSQHSRSKNIARLISEGYDPRQAAAIAYSTQRKAGCKVPRRKAKRNPPFAVYGVRESFEDRFNQIGPAADFAKAVLHDPHDLTPFDKMVVYDEARADRGPKGEFVAMFRPNGKRRRKGKKKPRSYKANPGLGDLAVMGLAVFGAWVLWKTYGDKVKAKLPQTTQPLPEKPPVGPTATAGLGGWL